MDTCSKCDGTGYIFVHNILAQERDYWKKEAEKASIEAIANVKEIYEPLYRYAYQQERTR